MDKIFNKDTVQFLALVVLIFVGIVGWLYLPAVFGYFIQ